MAYGPEYKLVEKPCIMGLQALGYQYLNPDLHNQYRDGENHVVLRPVLIEAIQRINGVSEDVARAAYVELLGESDNQKWLQLLRGDYSRNVPGQSTKKTLHLIDFLNPENNTFTVTNQFYVHSQQPRIPDLVVFINGIPVVVIEAKSPLSSGDKSGEAFDQVMQYERDIPRLFYSNVFNIITNGAEFLYGATGASSQYWATWKDCSPRTNEDFGGDPLKKGLFCLLEPSRLLDLIAHFVVFEANKDSGKIVKKICRYQQLRAVNKIVDRVVEGKHRRGLIWHTQGSGKSLTMVYGVLKLKTHRTVNSPELASPNILVLTDRIDLDDQISGTFKACGLPNPKQVKDLKGLWETVHSGTDGQVLLSTIFKFQGSTKPIPNSRNWIVLVDECHRTQEKDLGAYLRATMPDAAFFGFTGTPIKKNDKDTYANFGVPGEGYLDKYGIDDAVADGATVPIHYTSRKTEWNVDAAKIDILFDQWFADQSDERIEQIKKKGVQFEDVIKHHKRIDLIAYDIWTHFKPYALPDGFKAQIVAIDREAIILYKRALDKVIAEDLMKDGVPETEAGQQAADMSACVYSSNQEDGKPSEDKREDALRGDLRKHYLDHAAETAAKKNFNTREHPLKFLIVCDKLLTGFDAPIESVMYLDRPLKEHSLLQAIARTNRVDIPQKRNGLIVDYIGVSKKLDEALSSYRSEDVHNAMTDVEALRSALRAAHTEVMALMTGIRRKTGDERSEYYALIAALGTEDAWFTYRRKAKAFIAAYETLSPDPAVLVYQSDLKWVASFIRVATQHFEKRESLDHIGFSAKIRDMLEQHLEVTGLSTVCKLRKITDPEFWNDFEEKQTPIDLKTAAIRKSTELKKITSEKVQTNPHRYGPFSERVLEIIKRYDKGLIDAATALKNLEQVAHDLQAEDTAHHNTGLNERAYGVLKILEAFLEGAGEPGKPPTKEKGEPSDASGADNPLGELATAIDTLYADPQTAPVGWHIKEQLRKELRQMVRQLLSKNGFTTLKETASAIDDYAGKHYIKV